MVLDDVFDRGWRVRRSASHTLSEPPLVGLTLQLRRVVAVGPIQTEHLGNFFLHIDDQLSLP